MSTFLRTNALPAPGPRSRAVAGALPLALAAALACARPEPPPRLPEEAELRVVEDARGRPVAVDATGLEPPLLERLRETPPTAEEWATAFRVVSDDPDGSEAAPLAGTYRIGADSIRFVPRQAFARGRGYLASWRGADGVTDSELRFVPARQGASAETQVAAVYPSADLLPANLARFHIQFTAPMSPGQAAEHVRLEREGGERLVGAFERAAEVAEGSHDLREDWSEDRTRVTLTLATDAEGRPPLEVAGRYRLLVDGGWEDAEGVPLRDDFERVFAAAEPDREGPAPGDWTITPPVAPGAPLTVDFPAPLDHVGLEHALEVVAQDRRVAGTVRISNEERRWVFAPQRPWTDGSYVVRVLAGLDDPAGNPLEAGSAAGSGREPAPGTATVTVLPFRVELVTPPPARRRGAAGS